jgi:hypothetical protein
MACFLKFLCFFSLLDLHSAKKEAVVFVVDPSWDCVESYVAHVPLLQEYKIIKVMTQLGESVPCNAGRANIYKNITFNSWTPNDTLATEEICPQLKNVGFPIAAVIPTFDPAVYLTDRLAACLGVRGNPSKGPLWNARRNKLAMSNAVKKAGLRSVKEKEVSKWSEAKDYLESLNPPLSPANQVVFKILEGSSSLGVTKIHSLKQAKEVWYSQAYAAVKSIVIQECLKGKEYVIDSASRDGVHKVIMVYHEDLRPGNGIFDLYYGFLTMDPRDEKTKAIIDYANKVLDATDLRNGASDMEVFWLEDEGTPCVVDLNARWTALMWHDGLALEQKVAGHDHITATISAYLDGDAFNSIPSVPSLRQHGALAFVNSFRRGILKSIPGLAVAEKMPSYLGISNKDAVVGNLIVKYSGFHTQHTPLYVLLGSKDKAVLDADYEHIIDLEVSNAFYDVTPHTGYTLMLAGSMLAAVGLIAVGSMLAAVVLFAAMSRRKLPDNYDHVVAHPYVVMVE